MHQIMTSALGGARLHDMMAAIRWPLSVIAATIALSVPAQAAPITNGGFEAPVLAPGWTTVGPVQSVSGLLLSDGTGSRVPTEGERFGLLRTDGSLPTTAESAAFSADAGALLTFDTFVSTDESLTRVAAGNNDQVYVRLKNLDDGTSSALLDLDVATLLATDGADGPWTSVSYTFVSSGLYQLALGVVDRGDDSGLTFLGVDNVTVGGVPLPSPLVLLLSGLLVVGALLRTADTANGTSLR